MLFYLQMKLLLPEEVGRAHFSLATPTYAAVAYIIHIIIHHLKLFQEEGKVALQRIFR